MRPVRANGSAMSSTFTLVGLDHLRLEQYLLQRSIQRVQQISACAIQPPMVFREISTP